jgi:hypothetical protein
MINMSWEDILKIGEAGLMDEIYGRGHGPADYEPNYDIHPGMFDGPQRRITYYLSLHSKHWDESLTGEEPWIETFDNTDEGWEAMKKWAKGKWEETNTKIKSNPQLLLKDWAWEEFGMTEEISKLISRDGTTYHVEADIGGMTEPVLSGPE